MPIENKMLSSSIENAQKQAWKARNFGIRKNVLQFDDVMNQPARDHLRASAARCCDGEDVMRE